MSRENRKADDKVVLVPMEDDPHGLSGQCPPGYSPGPNRRTTEGGEMLAPPWGVSSSPYQTYYSQPMVNGQHGQSASSSTQSSNAVVVQSGNSANTVCVEPLPKNYTALSVFNFLCCCLPMGLCALFYARDAQTMWLHGQPKEAVKRSRISRNLNIAGIIIGSLILIAFVIWIVVAIVSARSYYRRDYNYNNYWTPNPYPD